ncbi:MAG: PilN domain-containing protein [Dehalococcoidia bacterium]
MAYAMRRGSKLIDLNVLPREMRPVRYPRWYVLGLAAIMVGCVLLVPAIFFQRSANNQTSDLNRQLLVISGQLTGVQMDIGRERGVRAEIAKAQAALSSVQAERKTVLGMDTPVSKDLQVINGAIPPGVGIISVAKSESKIVVSGQAPSIESVIAFATALDASGSFSGVTITSLGVAAGGGGASPSFTVEVAQ